MSHVSKEKELEMLNKGKRKLEVNKVEQKVDEAACFQGIQYEKDKKFDLARDSYIKALLI